MKKIFFSLILCCIFSSTYAMLPPYAQSISELEAIFHSEECSKQIVYPIVSIETHPNKRTSGNTYIIKTTCETLIVDVLYSENEQSDREPLLGPKSFTLHFRT